MFTVLTLSALSASTCVADGCTISAILTALSFGGNPRRWALLLGSCHALLLGLALWFAGGLQAQSELLPLIVAIVVTTAAFLHVLREQRHQGCRHTCCVNYRKRVLKLVAGGLPLLGVAFIVSFDSFGHGLLIHQAYPALSRAQILSLSLTSGLFVAVIIGAGMNAGVNGIQFLRKYSLHLGRPLLFMLGACWLWLVIALGEELLMGA